MNHITTKVKELLSKQNLPNIALLVCYTLAFLIMSALIVPYGDDKSIYNILIKNHGIRGALSDYYFTWGGRVIPTFLWLLFFSKFPLKIWAVFNALFFFGFIYCLPKLSIIDIHELNKKQRSLTTLIICSLLFSLSFSTLFYSILWYTGSFYYLWSSTCLFIAMIPYKKLLFNQTDRLRFYILYAPAAIYASYFEQTALIMIAFGLIILILYFVKKRKIQWKQSLLYLLILINSAISLLAPGNAVRSKSEVIGWYPDFDMLSIPDKLLNGFCLTFDHLFNNSLLLFTFLCVLIFLIHREKPNSNYLKTLSAIPLCYALLNLIPFDQLFSKVLGRNIDIGHTITAYLFKFSDFNSVSKFPLSSYIGIFSAMTVSLFLIYLIYTSFQDRKRGFYYVLFYLAGFCADLIMSFSPTIYASGNRALFISDVCLILVVVGLIQEFMACRVKSKLFTGAVLIVFTISSVLLLKDITQIKAFLS